MLLGDLLGKPLVIDGQDVVLVDDHIGDSRIPVDELDKIIEIEAPDGPHLGFYTNEDYLIALRTQYPDHTPYGIWQTLYHSGMLSGAEYLFLPFDEGSGRYAKLIQQEGEWIPLMSGVVTGGALTDDPMVSLDDTHRLNIDTSLLRLPSEPAMLHRERLAMLQKRSRKRYWTTGLICLGILALGAVYEGVMMLQHSSRVSTLEELRAEMQGLDERVALLTQSRLASEPDYTAALEKIFHLYTLDPAFVTAKNSRLDKEVILVMDRNTLPFLRTIDWVIPEITDDGSIAVRIKGGG